MARSAPSITELLRRFLAVGAAMLVLTLTVSAASPHAHEWLHHEDDHAAPVGSADEHTCAVVLFASGVSLPVDPIEVRMPETVVAAISPATAAEVYLVTPRYLRQPERGPPGA